LNALFATLVASFVGAALAGISIVSGVSAMSEDPQSIPQSQLTTYADE
jgi:hypothetical protein